MKKVSLSQCAKKQLLKAVNGKGGFQGLMRELQGYYDPIKNELKVTSKNLARMEKYSLYTKGGYESRLNEILKCSR